MTGPEYTGFSVQQHTRDWCTVYYNQHPLAEIKKLYLVFARFSHNADSIIDSNVPMPLFWWQYIDHE